MKKSFFNRKTLLMLAFFLPFMFFAVSCEEVVGNDEGNNDDTNNSASTVFLLIDEESIDNGNEPNNFSATDVNDQLASIGLRTQLKYFSDNVGKTIELFTGQVGDEGWHAPKTIPTSWKNAGPTTNGLRNYLAPGPGLGSGNDDREVLLDEIPDVMPLRATGLAMLKGQTVLAVVYDGDVSTNYSPILANLQGANLGIVAFKVLDIRKRTGGSDSSLPIVRIEILNANTVKENALFLFTNAPVLKSSSEPEDVTPPTNVPKIELVAAP